MQFVFSIDGLPELNARLDKIAVVVANPVTRDALQAGGKVIKDKAEQLVHRLTGMLAGDIVVVTRMRTASQATGTDQKYVLIGPGWNPDLTRHSGFGVSRGPYATKLGAISRQASNREVKPADATTNPGVYGYFLEVGHRAPGEGLNSNQKYRRDAAAARKQGKRLNSYTTPTSRDYGNLSTPPYPWLEPAFDQSKDQAVAKMAEVIESELGALGI
jgi:HK97 gp10 family phage protein